MILKQIASVSVTWLRGLGRSRRRSSIGCFVCLPDTDSRPVVGRWLVLELTEHVSDRGLAGALGTDHQELHVVVHF